jgi:hypothetical protein
MRGVSRVLLWARGVGTREIFRFSKVDALDEHSDIGEIFDYSSKSI